MKIVLNNFIIKKMKHITVAKFEENKTKSNDIRCNKAVYYLSNSRIKYNTSYDAKMYIMDAMKNMHLKQMI